MIDLLVPGERTTQLLLISMPSLFGPAAHAEKSPSCQTRLDLQVGLDEGTSFFELALKGLASILRGAGAVRLRCSCLSRKRSS